MPQRTLREPEIAAAFISNEEGVRLFREKKFVQARQKLEKANQLDPLNFVYLKNLAELFLQENELEKATIYYTQVVKLAPERPDFKLKLAQIYASLKKFDEAFELGLKNPQILNFILREIFNQYQGLCLKCGECCREMILVHKEKVITTEAEFAELCQQKPEFQRWQPFRDKKGVLRFNCGWLDRQNQCRFYPKRDEPCRNYPDFRTSTLKPGCGYQRKIEADFQKIKNKTLKAKILKYAKKLNPGKIKPIR